MKVYTTKNSIVSFFKRAGKLGHLKSVVEKTMHMGIVNSLLKKGVLKEFYGRTGIKFIGKSNFVPKLTWTARMYTEDKKLIAKAEIIGLSKAIAKTNILNLANSKFACGFTSWVLASQGESNQKITISLT